MTREELNTILDPLIVDVNEYYRILINIVLLQESIFNKIKLFNCDLEIFLISISSFYRNDEKIKKLVIKLKL